MLSARERRRGINPPDMTALKKVVAAARPSLSLFSARERNGLAAESLSN